MERVTNNRRPRQYCLEDLGIRSSVNSHGDERLTIDLGVNPVFGTAKCVAVFDESTRRWKLITSTQATFKDGTQTKRKLTTPSLRSPPATYPGTAYWTESLPRSPHTDCFTNEINWAATPLGPIESWPNVLRTCCHLVFADSHAAVIYWGPDLITIGNKFFIEQLTVRLRKSSVILGKPFKELFPELWHDFEPLLVNISETGQALDQINVSMFPTDSRGVIEETFWTGSFLPIRGEGGKTLGYYNRGWDATRDVLRERWITILNGISAAPHGLVTVWEHVFRVLDNHSRDFPVAFAYSATEAEDGRCTLHLQQSLGFAQDGHPLVPRDCDLYEGISGFMPFLRKAKATNQIVLLHKSDGTLPDSLTADFVWRGFGDTSTSLCILPIAASNRILGFCVFFLNPRRPYDSEYEGFINSLGREMSATIASYLDREEAHRRTQRLTQQLADSEKQIRDLAEYGPVGILRVTPNGKIVWANPQFYEITGHSEDHYELSFIDVVDPEDQASSASFWHIMIEEHKSVSAPFRLKKRWRPPASTDGLVPDEEPAWIHANAYPVIEHGQVTSVAGSVIDISSYKWAENVQSRVAKDAHEAKRLQENFIDVVSHEMRNPLSAIIQLADDISTSLEDIEEIEDSKSREILQSNVESAETILLCAAHQKRIIDDVLTLSKLDSMMLSVTPIVVRPYDVVSSVLKMFEAEFETQCIEVESSVDETYAKFSVDWVTSDPSRVTQIFINLITNAVKFTKFEPTRRIFIRVGASQTRPPPLAGVTWFPTNQQRQDLTVGPEWGGGEPLYIWFEVSDTGTGLEQEEMKRLFMRFQQATAKTHITYGGSGLGLFISRELTETQGGEIGVVSTPGKGSTFAFYIKVKRAQPPGAPPATPNIPRRGSRKPALIAKETSAKSRPRCIILVEDNIVNSKVLTKQLEKAKCEVYLANHGEECLDLIRKTTAWRGSEVEDVVITPDCILMDIEMPIMDGLTATRRIRQLEQEGKITKHLNIIAITANARKEQIQQTMEAGADAVQPKPFRVKDLLEKIEEVIKKAPE